MLPQPVQGLPIIVVAAIGIVVNGVFEFLKALILLPARLLRGPKAV